MAGRAIYTFLRDSVGAGEEFAKDVEARGVEAVLKDAVKLAGRHYLGRRGDAVDAGELRSLPGYNIGGVEGQAATDEIDNY